MSTSLFPCDDALLAVQSKAPGPMGSVELRAVPGQ